MPKRAIRLSAREAEKLGLKKPHKYRAKATVERGIRFASKREAVQYANLKFYEEAGVIRNLELQPRFPIVMNGIKCGEYRADFRYVINLDGQTVIEDVKGFRTKEYKLKKKLVEAQYGIKIEEI